MKKISKVFLLLTLPLLLDIVITGCSCDDTQEIYYSNCDLQLVNIDNSKQEPLESPDSVSRNTYGIRVTIQRNENQCASRSPNSLFIPRANAFSMDGCPAVLYNAIDSITDFQIFTLKDFNSDYPAGSNVTTAFNVYDAFNYYSVATYMSSIHGVHSEKTGDDMTFNLLLMTAPTIGVHQFEVSMQLTDGRIFTAQTEALKLH